MIHNDVNQIKAEIFARGPVAAAIHGPPLHSYHGGIFSNDTAPKNTTHVVSIVGWGVSSGNMPYWHCRNSWGQYWGEMGFFRIELGKNILGIESSIAWATPGSFSVLNDGCLEQSQKCDCQKQKYVDPSLRIQEVRERLRAFRSY
jgi:cathepsin X